MTKGRTFDEIGERFQRKLALYDGRCVGLRNERHRIRRFAAYDGAFCISTATGKYEVISHRFDFNAIRNAVQVANDFLEIIARQIDDSGIFYIGHNQFLRLGFDETQFVPVTLPYLLVIILQTELRNDTIVIIRLFDVNRQNVFICHRRNELEQLLCVGTNDDFVWMANIFLEFFCIKDDIHENGVRLGIEIDDFHSLFGKSDSDIRQNVLDGRNHVAYRLYLQTLDSQYVVFFIHRCSYVKNNRVYFFMLILRPFRKAIKNV